MSRLITVVAAAMLAGCQSMPSAFKPPRDVAAPDYANLQQPFTAGAWQQGTDVQAGLLADGAAVEMTSETVSKTWWREANHELLNVLVEQALTANASLAQAAANVAQAEATWRAVTAGALPQISATANAAREKVVTGAIANFSQLGVRVDYALDLFGKQAASTQAAAATYQQQAALMHFTQATVAAHVVAAYIQYQTLTQQQALLVENLSAQEDIVELNTILFEAGEITQIDVDRVLTQYHLTQAQAQELDRLQQAMLLQLATLMTQPVQNVTALFEQYEDAPLMFSPKSVLQSKLSVIAQRPDVMAQRYALDSTNALTQREIASWYPDISLGGFFGLADVGFSLSETVWSLGANAAMRLFDFGQREQLMAAARAQEAAAVAQYQQTVNAAVLEVESVLNDLAAYQRQSVQYRLAAERAERAYEHAQLLYQEGEISLLELLDAQRVKNQAKLELVQSQSNSQLAIAGLYKALAPATPVSLDDAREEAIESQSSSVSSSE